MTLEVKDNVLTWKHFVHYWYFVCGIHQALVDSLHKGPVMKAFDVLFIVSLDKL